MTKYFDSYNTYHSQTNTRLLVEVAPTGLENLVKNPSGDKGTWFYRTPVSNTTMGYFGSGPSATLTFSTFTSQAAYFTTNAMPITASEYVAARYDLSLSSGHKVRFEWLDAAGTLLSSSTQSTYDATNGTHYYGPVQAPSTAAYVRLRWDLYSTSAGANPTAGQGLQFKQVMVTHAATAAAIASIRTNLVTGPSVEFATSKYLGYGTSTTPTRVTTQHQFGAAALQVTSSGVNDTTSAVPANITGTMAFANGATVLPVTGGKDYVASFYSKAATTARTGVLWVRWLDSNGVWINQTATLVESTTNSTAGFVRHQAGPFTAPTNAVSGQFGFGVKNSVANEVHYFDGLMVEQASTVGPYFDGSTTATTSSTYAWLGTAHDSASKESTSTFAFTDPYYWLNILSANHSITIDRSQLQVGTLNAEIRDHDLDPSQGGAIKPGKLIRLQTTTDGTTWKNVYEGKISNATVTYPVDRDKSVSTLVLETPRITFSAVDNVSTLAQYHEGRGVAISDLPYTMEGKDVPWLVNGSGGQATSVPGIVSTNDNASMVDQIALARDSEMGQAWVNKENVLMVNTPANAFNGTYYNFTSDAGGLSYVDIDADFDTTNCFNYITVKYQQLNPDGSTTEVDYGPYTNDASIKTWGVLAKEFKFQGPAANLAFWANSILAANGTPKYRPRSITVAVQDATTFALVTDLDIYNKVKVKFADKYNGDVRVTGIQHTITPDKWYVTLNFDTDGAVASPQQIPSPNTQAGSTYFEFNHPSQNTGTAVGWQRQTGGSITIDVPGYYLIHHTEAFGNGTAGTTAFRAMGVSSVNGGAQPDTDLQSAWVVAANSGTTITQTYMKWLDAGSVLTPWRYTSVANHYGAGAGYLRAVRVA